MKLSQYVDPRFQAAARDAARKADAAADPWAAEDAAALAAQLEALAEMRELAVRMARAAAMAQLAGAEVLPPASRGRARDADAAPGDGAAEDAAAAAWGGGAAELAFQRCNRTLRLTIALETRLRADRRARLTAAGAAKAERAWAAGRGAAAAAAQDKPALSPEKRAKLNTRLLDLVIRKRVIVSAVQDLLAQRGEDDEVLEDVGRMLGERLLDVDTVDTLELPIGRMIARICRDMRLTPDWSRWKHCDWAVEEAETQAEGSPYGDPKIEPAGWLGGVPVPHPDAGTLELLARGFGEADKGVSSG